MRVAPDQRHRQIELLLGQRDGKVGEGVEGDGNLVAVRTRQFRFVLTREENDVIYLDITPDEISINPAFRLALAA